MKKKIITSVIITVIFALVIITSSFMALSSVQEIQNTRNILKNYNEIVAKWKDVEKEDLNKDLNIFKINKTNIRFTIIDKNGKVTFDSLGDNDYKNHNGREEIDKAKIKGVGYSDRYSDTLKTDMIYCATKFNDGTIIRSGVPESTIKIFYKGNMKYYIVASIMVLIFSIALAFKLVRIIVDPVKHLESVTSKIANGNLQTRVNISSNDELGQLGKTFNNMTDQLQGKINEVLDKQSSLESILNCMQSGLIAVDNDNRIITINPYAQIIFGINFDVTGKYLTDSIKEKNIKNILEDESDKEVEIKIKKPVERFLKIKRANIIKGYKRIGRVIAIQDITEMKRLENIRTQFVANVSHELKTPLTSIKGFAETLRYVEDEKTKLKFLDIIDKESVRLTRLINDILILSNLESAVVEEMEEFLPDDIIDDVVNILSDQAIKKDIKINFNRENVNYILGQRDKFFQVAINIIENAIKYSNEGSIINIRSYSSKEYYIFEVEDNGVGIPEEDIPRIFERFYRVDKARKSGGTGLGLAIVKHIVKSLGGTIDVYSKLNEGTKFVLKIKYIYNS